MSGRFERTTECILRVIDASIVWKNAPGVRRIGNGCEPSFAKSLARPDRCGIGLGDLRRGAASDRFCAVVFTSAHLDLAGGDFAQDEFLHFRQRVLHLGHDRL